MPETAAKLTLSVARSAEDRAHCLAVRREVFVGEQGVSVEEEIDGLDDECIHVLARDGAAAVGTARIRGQGATAKIQRVCVRPDWRGTGAGAAIMRFTIDLIRADGRFGAILLGSQTHALPFYAKLGFAAFGEEYPDAGIPHRDMEMKL